MLLLFEIKLFNFSIKKLLDLTNGFFDNKHFDFNFEIGWINNSFKKLKDPKVIFPKEQHS